MLLRFKEYRPISLPKDMLLISELRFYRSVSDVTMALLHHRGYSIILIFFVKPLLQPLLQKAIPNYLFSVYYMHIIIETVDIMGL